MAYCGTPPRLHLPCQFERLTLRLVRYGLVLVTLVALLPMIAATSSCGIDLCGGYCERDTQATYCPGYTEAKCSVGYRPDPDCEVRSGCHCAFLANGEVDSTACDISDCATAIGRAQCLQKRNCEWGNACQNAVDCSALPKDACKRQHVCNWYPPC